MRRHAALEAAEVAQRPQRMAGLELGTDQEDDEVPLDLRGPPTLVDLGHGVPSCRVPAIVLAQAPTGQRGSVQGLMDTKTKVASRTRCTPPCSGFDRPGTTVSTDTITVSASSTIWVVLEPEHQRAVEPDLGHGDGRDGEPDRGHRRAVGEVEARPARGRRRRAHRGDRLRQQHQAAITTPTSAWGSPAAPTAFSSGCDSTLASPTTATSASEQQVRLTQRRAVARHVVVAVVAARSEPVSSCGGRKKSRCRTGLGEHEQAVERQRHHGREAELGRR